MEVHLVAKWIVVWRDIEEATSESGSDQAFDWL
jgi:hypothetical protein